MISGRMPGSFRKLKIIFLFAFFSLLTSHFTLLTTAAFAAGEFAVAYDLTYEVQKDGSAKAVADIALTNRLSNVYATEYNLVIEKGEIAKIGAWDSQGEIESKIEKEGEQTKINLKFNDQVVGVGKTLRFTLKYETAGLAKKSGQVWQVTLPQQADLTNFADYRLTLKIPKSFPALSLISPQPFDEKTTNDFYQYSFTKKDLVSKGIVAVFGQFQVFDFRLTYHLSNPKREPVYTEIALPPTTLYQKVSLFDLEPKPEDVEVDEDGNWLAKYLLSSKEEKKVVAQGQVQIYAQSSKKAEMGKENLNEYLKPQPFWEIDHPEIQKLAQDLRTPEAIYNFVIETLSYDFEKVKTKQERMGAASTLQNPKEAICMEFTDLFIALSRAAGIPARELNGFAYTDNPKLKPLSQSADILHSWPEYWDREKNVWVQVDPTWEKTSGIDYFGKFDLSHFTFAIHGVDSQYPAAAGSYKQSLMLRNKKDSQKQKDIEVDFGTFEGEKISQIKAQFLLPKSYFVERGVKGKIVLENLGPTALYDLPVKLNLDPKGLNLKVLPPFGKEEIPVEISSSWWPRTGETSISLLANQQNFSYNMIVNSLILNFVLPVVGGVVVSGSLLVFILKYRR